MTFAVTWPEVERKEIVNISSTVASLAWGRKYHGLPDYAYKLSKAALNSLTVQYALNYQDEGSSVYAISPGYVKTDMGGETADLPVDVSATAVLKYIRAGG
ncbi:hypothetical protein BDW74DRAFT_175615 [Aspergillus multicolor]|uniref:uncharacterized protein n=1 Tax=Aspergillus multicolor TaxID=41759 RepID=UPI003CCE159C